MTSIVDFERNRPRLEKELFRRIGYTNTLFKILRFGDIIRETHALFPVTPAVLISHIRRTHRELRGQDYASGVVDILCALEIAARAGPRLILTAHGRALAAIAQQEWYDDAKLMFFLRAVLDTDGDYILNLLGMLPGTEDTGSSLKSVGVRFFQRLIDILEKRTVELERCIPDKRVREFAVERLKHARDSIRYDILSESRPAKRLSREEKLRFLKSRGARGSGSTEDQPTETIRHTLDPRKGWLLDLGLLRAIGGKYQLTDAGGILLSEVKRHAFDVDNGFRVPFSQSIAGALGIECSAIPDDFFLTLAVRAYHGGTGEAYSDSADEFLESLHGFFPLVRLKRFNQAEILSLYECLALKAGTKGRVLSTEVFESKLSGLLETRGDQIYRVSPRRGQEGYLSFRR